MNEKARAGESEGCHISACAYLPRWFPKLETPFTRFRGGFENIICLASPGFGEQGPSLNVNSGLIPLFERGIKGKLIEKKSE